MAMEVHHRFPSIKCTSDDLLIKVLLHLIYIETGEQPA